MLPLVGRRLVAPLALALVGGWVLTGCRPDTVSVAFHPPVGARFRYQVDVEKTRTIKLGSEAPQRTVDQTALVADETVLASGPEGTRVRVELRRPGSLPRTYVVLFDRAAQLTAVESIEGLPASILDPFGLSEIFPAAAGAPPARPLAAGERWRINETLRLGGTAAARLTGAGRLLSFGVVDGRKVASIRSSTRLPVTTDSALQGGQLSLQGTERTVSTATREITDGAVEKASSTTNGSYDVVLNPPIGQGVPVNGSMTIEVRSKTQRMR